MSYYVRLDVSVNSVSICIVNEKGSRNPKMLALSSASHQGDTNPAMWIGQDAFRNVVTVTCGDCYIPPQQH